MKAPAVMHVSGVDTRRVKWSMVAHVKAPAVMHVSGVDTR